MKYKKNYFELYLILYIIIGFMVYRINATGLIIDENVRGEITEAIIDTNIFPGWLLWLRRIVLMAEFFLMIVVFKKIQKLPKYLTILLIYFFIWRFALLPIQMGFSSWRFSDIFAELGIFATLSSIFIYLGYDVEYWKRISNLLFYIGVILSLLIIVDWFFNWDGGGRLAGWKLLSGYMYLLNVTFMFVIAKKLKNKTIKLISIVACLFAFLLCCFYTQTRAEFIYFFICILFFSALQYKNNNTKKIIILSQILIVIICVISVVVLDDNIYRLVLNRLDEDTRGSQFSYFFEVVSPYELVLGSPESGHDPRFITFDNKLGIDSGYILMLFCGGIPFILLYYMIHIRPAIKAMFCRLDTMDCAVVATVMGELILMFSSQVPNMSEEYFVLLILIGRCVAISRQHKNIKFKNNVYE